MDNKQFTEKSFERALFESLYGNTDFDGGINNAIALIGEKYEISRVYVFENSEDNRFGDNTFEWCAAGITPQIDELQHMSYEEYGYYEMFADNGAFICPDVKELPDISRELFESQDIKATLQYALYDKEEFRGFVGFDDCNGPRPDWALEHEGLDTLIFLSKLLSVYLLKERNLQNSQKYHRKMEAALELSELANRAKTDFLSRMSHDIRTPLNGIIGMTAIAQQDNKDPKVENSLNLIASSGKFLLSLINDILDISKIENGSMVLHEEPVPLENFDAVIDSVIRPLMKAKSIEFEYAMDCGMKCACIDPVRFNQIFFNLLSNAAKYTPEGGKVSFLAEQLSSEAEWEWVRFTVRDNGIGMSPEFARKAFKPFEQEEKHNSSLQNQGTGLGLAITKELVELMGGTIAIESEPGKGSTFTIDMPLKRAELPNHAVVEQKRQNVTEVLSDKKVLLVEDNHVNAIVASRLLESKGMKIVIAHNGVEAIEQFSASEEKEYDVVLMDIRMPVMNGLEATENIRSLPRSDAKHVPIIAMTANAFEEDARECLEAGMDAHITKPIDPEAMFETIARQLMKEK